MPEVRETLLPGVGVRHEFTTVGGERVALLTHRSGRREIAIYDRDDPDAGRTVLHLNPEDTRTLGELLGTSQVSEAVLGAQRIEGLALDWIVVSDRSSAARTTIAESKYRSSTGATIVAVVRGERTHPAPGPEFALAPGDVAVAVGTPEGLTQLRALLTG